MRSLSIKFFCILFCLSGCLAKRKLTRGDLPETRQKIVQDYKAAFQNYLNDPQASNEAIQTIARGVVNAPDAKIEEQLRQITPETSGLPPPDFRELTPQQWQLALAGGAAQAMQKSIDSPANQFFPKMANAGKLAMGLGIVFLGAGALAHLAPPAAHRIGKGAAISGGVALAVGGILYGYGTWSDKYSELTEGSGPSPEEILLERLGSILQTHLNYRAPNGHGF